MVFERTRRCAWRLKSGSLGVALVDSLSVLARRWLETMLGERLEIVEMDIHLEMIHECARKGIHVHSEVLLQIELRLTQSVSGEDGTALTRSCLEIVFAYILVAVKMGS
jgi:hypothetical protein